MNTSENQSNGNLETVLPIRTTSGGKRGVKGSGTDHEYFMPKAIFMALVSEVFDLEVKGSNPDNETSGGAISQFCHAYGVSGKKIESSGRNPFPKTGGTFDENNAQDWLEILEFKKPREAGSRKTAKTATLDAVLISLKYATWEQLAPEFPGITLAEVEAHKAAKAA
jgi:hypothetical protein